MSTLTYTSLIADMKAYSDKGKAGDVTTIAQIPRLITRAEYGIVTDAELKGYERTLIWALEDGLAIYQKPERHRSMVLFTIATGATSETRKTLLSREYGYLSMFWPDRTVEGTPTFYADHGEHHWLLCATPDAAYPAEVKDFAQPMLLGETNETNWLTDEAPNLLQSRAMLELAIFSKNAADVQKWMGVYQQDLGAFKGKDMSKVMDRAAERDGP